jgi:hypothetical protein
MLASTAKWKLVLGHQNPYSSGSEGNLAYMRWPFSEWGATAAVWGHDHDYERLEVDGLPHFISGAGGVSLRGFLAPVEGSQVRYSADYGALLITASDAYMTFQFVTRTGKVIDYYTVGQVPPPAEATALTARPLAYKEIGLSWTDNSSDENGFLVERSTDGLTFAQIGMAPTNSTSYTDRTTLPATSYTYRIRAMNSGGKSAYSNTASATTFDMASVVFLSDLTWTSATNGWGPVEKDTSNGSIAAGDGRRITLNGVEYGKGLGVHAPAEITFDLAVSPTRGLDLASSRATLAAIHSVADRGGGVLLVTSDLDEAREVADALHVIFRGRLSRRFPPDASTAELGRAIAGLPA